MSYHVRLIGDDQLPADYSWAMVHHEHDYYFFVKPEGLTADALEKAWAAYRVLNAQPVGAGR